MTKTFCDHCGTEVDFDTVPWTLVQLGRRRFDLCQTCVEIFTKMVIYLKPPADGEKMFVVSLADGAQGVGLEDLEKLKEFVRFEGAL